MAKRKLPRAERPTPWFEAPSKARQLSMMVSRREFLKGLAVIVAAVQMPFTRVERAWAAARGKFFTARERATLAAYADRILPPDADPGAKTLGVAKYVENLLTAFDTKVPRIYAGGPFS